MTTLEYTSWLYVPSNRAPLNLAYSAEGLGGLFEMTVNGFQGQVDAIGAELMGEHGTYTVGVSGTLGGYHVQLDVNRGARNG